MADQWMTSFLRSVAGRIPPGGEELPQPIADVEEAGQLIAQGNTLFGAPAFRFFLEANEQMVRQNQKELDAVELVAERLVVEGLRHQIAMLQIEVARGQMIIQLATAAAASQRGLQDMVAQIERGKADTSTRNALIAGGLPILGQLLTGGGR